LPVGASTLFSMKAMLRASLATVATCGKQRGTPGIAHHEKCEEGRASRRRRTGIASPSVGTIQRPRLRGKQAERKYQLEQRTKPAAARLWANSLM